MHNALGMIELSSMAKGFEVSDIMLKTSTVELVAATSVCPGKYFVIVHGDVAAVDSAVRAGREIADTYIVDDFVLANVHPEVFPAITATTQPMSIKALGVLEAFSIATMIIAADAALKSADIDAIELRLGSGMGGKSYFTMTGDVSAVNEAVEIGSQILAESGMMVEKVVIPRPAPDLLEALL